MFTDVSLCVFAPICKSYQRRISNSGCAAVSQAAAAFASAAAAAVDTEAGRSDSGIFSYLPCGPVGGEQDIVCFDIRLFRCHRRKISAS